MPTKARAAKPKLKTRRSREFRRLERNVLKRLAMFVTTPNPITVEDADAVIAGIEACIASAGDTLSTDEAMSLIRNFCREWRTMRGDAVIRKAVVRESLNARKAKGQ